MGDTHDVVNKPRLLVVDDDPRLLHIVTLFLGVAGYEVTSATCGEEALEAIEQHRPDLIISDVMMPGIDGVELCRRLRARPDTATVPIIMFTALSDAADIRAAHEAGANQLITKPFNLTGLGAVVKSFLPQAATA